MFEFFVGADFIDSLEALPKTITENVKEKLRFLQTVENPLFFAKKLKGYKDFFRFRVGHYRIVFQRKHNRIVLLLVKHRKDIYEGL